MDLNGKHIILTGASRGLGRSVALKLAARGTHLSLLARGSADLERIEKEVRAGGSRAVCLACDVSDDEAVYRTLVEADRAFGPPDILVNSAGLGRYNPLERLTPGEIHEMVDVNLKGTLFMTQAVYQRMRPRASGLIVNVLSTAGREAKARETAYCASKWGVMGFTKALALEGRKFGIRVTAFCPGGMDTSFWDHEPPDRKPNLSRFLSAETAADALIRILDLPENVEIPEFAIRGMG